ncbi:MAG: glycosyltransferase involved in cell wall biosynthesis, partial [Flavobacteriales bacterium]
MISIVLPIYNEEAGLASFVRELSLELTKTSENAEVIFVNDGSKDNSLTLIKKICEE